MKQFDVGYEGELIGRYPGETEAEAKQACKEHMQETKFQPDTPARERLKGLIAIPVVPVKKPAQKPTITDIIEQVIDEIRSQSKSPIVLKASKFDIETEIIGGINSACVAHQKTGGKNLPKFLQDWAEISNPRLGEDHLENVLKKELAHNKTYLDWAKTIPPKKDGPEMS